MESFFAFFWEQWITWQRHENCFIVQSVGHCSCCKLKLTNKNNQLAELGFPVKFILLVTTWVTKRAERPFLFISQWGWPLNKLVFIVYHCAACQCPTLENDSVSVGSCCSCELISGAINSKDGRQTVAYGRYRWFKQIAWFFHCMTSWSQGWLSWW